jgi:hypothetical protein
MKLRPRQRGDREHLL